MDKKIRKSRIALIGGGPSALYACKHFITSGKNNFELHIFEKTDTLGAGMPYSTIGANPEHVTNISATEIPELVCTVQEWIYTAPPELLERFNIIPSTFNEYDVLPRLFFGEYLSAQFHLLFKQAREKDIPVHIHLNHTVLDVADQPDKNEIVIETDKSGIQPFDIGIICTGHFWPEKLEGSIPGYYDSPYPPSKLRFQANHTVAVRGSSLTAIDVIRTMSRMHGSFSDSIGGFVSYKLSDENKSFRMVLHSSNGMLPAIRIDLQETYDVLTPECVAENRKQNNGFLSLDFVFDVAFKKPLLEKDPEFYARIQHMSMEMFVAVMLKTRERQDAFLLFEKEYKQADVSIQQHVPIYWKELLAGLSFTMNYPAKYFSAEDMDRLQHTLSELISIVIAFVPQSSAREILALHVAGVLDIIEVDPNSHVEPVKTGGVIYHYANEHKNPVSEFYPTYINAVGQPHVMLEDFPFKTLVKENTVSQARVRFKDAAAGEKEISAGNKDVQKDPDGSYFLQVPGITITDAFQVVDHSGKANDRIYIMAVPYISGYNPDYSGLDFCNKASKLICEDFFAKHSDQDAGKKIMYS